MPLVVEHTLQTKPSILEEVNSLLYSKYCKSARSTNEFVSRFDGGEGIQGLGELACENSGVKTEG